MNRKMRRMMQAEAEKMARTLAATCLDYTPAGELRQVRDARAVAVLQKAFAKMLRQGGEPVVMPISMEAARAFPMGGSGLVDMPVTARPWLAVGIDRAGQATYSLRFLGIPSRTPAEADDLAEVQMLTELARETNRAGFPGVRA